MTEEKTLLQEVRQHETQNLILKNGMLVNIYNYDNPIDPIYCGIGTVRNIAWSDEWMQYLVEVYFFQEGEVQTFEVFACQCLPLRGRANLKVIK